MLHRARKLAWQSRVAATLAATLYLSSLAQGGEIDILPKLNGRADFFGGIDGAKDTYFAWSGVTYAPAGRLDEDGFRVRIAGGAGTYRYRTGNVPGGVNDVNVMSGELLGGYRATYGKVYFSGYLGFHIEQQMLALPDPFNPTAGTEAGIKGSIEVYTRLWDSYVVTGFASASTVHRKYNARATLLRELDERWAFGLEGGALGDARTSELRAGLTGVLTWQRKIFALSAGVLDNSDKGTGAYATLSVYSPF
ncbi:MAG TPA: cellulose biosynthesis protein BcsS [Xanthobacteraceae bacterium]|nr:cellulose biosynthesis protein BcsS [Xanthobacteraceae bacterium]